MARMMGKGRVVWALGPPLLRVVARGDLREVLAFLGVPEEALRFREDEKDGKGCLDWDDQALRERFASLREEDLPEDVNVNSAADDGTTALLVAIRCGNLDLVKVLHLFGADLDAIDASGCSAIEWAGKGQMEDIFAYLSENGAIVPEDLRSMFYVTGSFL